MSGALDLGSLYSKLAVDFTDLSKAEGAARKFSKNAISGFEKTESSARKLKSVGKNASYVSGALLGVGLASAKMANNFDKNIAEINSLLPAADKDFKGLKDSVRGVALALGTDLNEAAGAAYQSISAGVPKDNIVSFLTVASKAAIAGVTNTEVAVDGITTVMNSWKESAGSAGDVADVMFSAVKNGKTTFEELSRGMFQVAGIAPELGVDFKEIAASAAAMTAQGVPTSVAMTQMRASMVAMSKPNKTMVELLKASGIESVKASIAQRGYVGTMDKLRKTADKTGINIQEAMGGAEAMGAVFKTTGENTDTFSKFLKDAENSAGAANAAFDEIDKQRGFDKIVNQFKIMSTIIGDALIPVLMPLAQSFASVLTKLKDLDPKLVQIGVVVAGVVAAVGPLVFIVSSAVTAIAPLVASAGGLGAALALVGSAALPVIGIVAALAAGAYILYKNWDSVTAFFQKAIGAIVSWFTKWKEDNAALISSVSQKWNELKEAGLNLWTSLLTVIKNFSESTMNWLNNILEPIGGLRGAWEILQVSVGEYLKILLGNVGTFFDFVKNVFTTITEVLNGNKTVWEGFKDILGHAVEAILEVLARLKPYFVETFKVILDYMKTLPSKFLQIGKDLLQGLANGIKEKASVPLNAIKDAANGMVSSVKGIFKTKSPSRVFAEIGNFTMQGLAMGIVATSPLAVQAAETAAGQTLMAFEKGIADNKESVQKAMTDAMGMQSGDSDFGGGGFGQSEFEDVGGGSIPGMPDITGITEYYDERLALLTEKGHAETELFKAIEFQKNDIVTSAQQTQLASYSGAFDTILGATKTFAGEQSGVYKAMFAVSKGFAIAEAALAMKQNIAKAMAVGFPQNIPFIAGAVSQGASIFSDVQSVAAPSAQAFYNGGTLHSGKSGIAGEKGVEIVGPTGILSTQKTKEMFSGMGSSGSSSINLNVEIINNAGVDVQVQESGEGEDQKLQIILDKVDTQMAGFVERGGGKFIPALQETFGLGRK